MAGAAGIDTKELEITIKGLLISRPTVVKANLLQRECEEELGITFPFRKLGFETFVDYLRSIPNVVQLEPYNGYNPDVYPVKSKASSHIDQLVSRQRVPPTKRRGVARRGCYNSRPDPARRRLTRPSVSRPTHPVVRRPNQGIDVRDLESYVTRNYDRRDLARNGIHSVDNLLSHAEGMVEGDTKVYPKLATVSNNTGGSSTVNGIPAGLEDEFEDYDDEYDEFYDEEVEKDSEEELSKQAIELWSQALRVEENGSSPRPPMPGGETSAVMMEGGLDQNVDLADDDSNISRGMINNFRKILDQNQDGIWASELQKLYFDQFHVSLDLLDLGHTSVISLASSLPKVFTYYREGSGDWILYDARYVTQESLDAQVKGGGVLLSENGRYVPQTIIENIKKLLDENINGFRSTDLLQLYRNTFGKSINLDTLGFSTLDEFLMILKNDVTLKKVLNYYLLLPKHRLMSHEALQPPKPDERLNVPAEALGVPIPDNVLRLGEEIPLQELPPVEMDPDPKKPLLELEVRVAEVMSPVFFYMTLGSTYEELEKMMDDLDKFYSWEEANFKIPLPHIAMNLYCAVKYDNRFWHRAKITRIKGNGDIEVEYIDYGTPGTVQCSDLRYLSKEFIDLPAQAICAKLIGVKPMNGVAKFPQDVCTEFLNIVDGKRLVAHVFEVAARVRHRQERMQLEVLLFDVGNPDQEMVINDYLVENGLASPIAQMQDSSTEVQQPVEDLLPESGLISLEATISPSVSQPSGLTPLPENVSSSLLGNTSTSLPASSKAKQENKPRGPPPGFQVQDFGLSVPPVSTAPTGYISSQTNSLYTEEQQMLINNYYLNQAKAHVYSQLVLQEQYHQQNVYGSNPSNMPLSGPPLFQSHHNGSQRSLTYGSIVPPQNAYHHPHANMYRQQEYRAALPVPSNYIQMNPPVPVGMIHPAHLLMNAPVRNQYLGFYPPNLTNASANVQGYGQGEFVWIPSMSTTPPPPTLRPMSTSTPPPPTLRPVSSPSPAFTPVTVPEWPLINRPASFTSAPSTTKIVSKLPEVNQIPRPCTPLTPASAEVANICNLSRPNSSCSHNSERQSANSEKNRSPLDNTSSKSQINIGPLDNTSSKSQIKESPLDNTSSKSQINISPLDNTSSKSQINVSPVDNTSSRSQINVSPVDNTSSKSQIKESPLDNSSKDSQITKSSNENAMSNFQSDKIGHDSINNSDPSLDSKGHSHAHSEVKEIPLPPDMDTKGIPLPPPSPEKLYSAISSPVDSLFRNSPFKEESSDDYASASENVEESKQQLTNLTLTGHYSITASKPPCDKVEDIPDSWENLDLDDTPAKAANFSVDFSQSLDLILKNMESESSLKSNSPVENSVSEVKSEESPLKIQAPANWKDIFNPDIINSSERLDNNNKVRGKSSSPTIKFNVKKIPVQKIEIQGKKIHLLNIDDTPAVVALEFFRQFSTNNSPAVSEKVVEVSHNKMYYISKAEYPAILSELNKVDEFFGKLQKKVVIRLNKVRVLNLSDIPQSLKVLNAPNKPLLDDLKKITNELASC